MGFTGNRPLCYIGTAIGAGLGFVGCVAGSMIFDSVYDKLRGK